MGRMIWMGREMRWKYSEEGKGRRERGKVEEEWKKERGG